MENYNLLQRLGKGAQGSVYLVEHIKEKKQYVLKKVECNDEHEANKAFKEAMALQELRHQFVCGYREFFVTWDKEEEAMFVCIVMDYYEMGDLAKVIKTKRKKKEKFDELILKKWLGQIIEALVFVHNKRVIHRDLKPSNIFMTTNLSISLGDFGVATVLGDARTRTRTTVGSMNWMAPEVMERPYDERSDVWGVGCILLELATCGILDSQETSGVLFEIKQNPQCLEDNFAKLVHNGFSSQMCQLIRDMLRRNFQQRPTAVDLLAYPYVKECLQLNPDSTLAKKKTKNSKPVEPIPKDKSPHKLYTYMDKNASNSEAQKQLFEILLTETNNKNYCVKVDSKMRKLIGKIMKIHTDVYQIQLNGCKILLNLLEKSASQSEVLFERDTISAVISAIKCDSTNRDLQLSAASLIMTLSAEETAAEKIGKLGGVQDILSILRQFKHDAEICIKCCSALWSLCVNENNAAIVTEEKGVKDICGVMENHQRNVGVIETACSAIWSLSLEEGNLDVLSEVAIIQIIEILNVHHKHEKLVKSGMMALASIVTLDEECAFKILNPNGNGTIQGMEILNKCYSHHKSSEEIADSYTTLLLELTEYDDVVDDLKAQSSRLKSIVEEISSKYRSNAEIFSSMEEVSERLNF